MHTEKILSDFLNIWITRICQQVMISQVSNIVDMGKIRPCYGFN